MAGGEIPVGTRPTLEIDARVDVPEPRVNQAEVVLCDQPDLDSTPNNDVESEDDYAAVTVTPQIAALRMFIDASDATPNQNEEMFYTLIVFNDGPSDASNVWVRSFLPYGLDFVRVANGAGEYDLFNGLWMIPEIDSGSAASMQLVATVDSKEPITSTAEIIASDQYDPNSTPDNGVTSENDYSLVTVTPKLIDVSVSAVAGNPRPALGEVVEMSFTVTNAGPETATGLPAAIVLPPELELVRAVPQRGTYGLPGSEDTWVIGEVAAGETVTVVLEARTLKRGTSVVNMQISSYNQADVDSDPNNNVESEDDQVRLEIAVPLFSKRMFMSEASQSSTPTPTPTPGSTSFFRRLLGG